MLKKAGQSGIGSLIYHRIVLTLMLVSLFASLGCDESGAGRGTSQTRGPDTEVRFGQLVFILSQIKLL